jgi:hypothetical protein
MPPDRLTALRRQRALVAEHLAWLDAEILAQTPFQALPVAPTVIPVAEPAAPSPPPPVPDSPALIEPAPEALAAANARADEIIATYAATERLDPAAARKGCIQLAAAVFLLGVAGVLAIYLIYY